MRRWRLIIIVGALLFAALAGAAETVTVRAYSEVAVFMERQAAARVESLDQAILAAEINARVVDIPVRVGQQVTRGELLLRLDEESGVIQRDSARARLEMAAAGLDMARLRAERARRLAPERFVSEDQLLEAETRLRQARAELAVAEQDLAAAELQVSRTRITAPYDGVVSARLLGVGALAAPGTPLLELVATGSLEISAGIAPELADGLTAASEMAYCEKESCWPIELARLSPVISPASRHRQARFQFVDQAALSGSEGLVRWTDPRPALPADFIVQRQGELGVLVLEDDQTVGFITLPRADAGRPLTVDLPAQTRLIDEGRRRVQPGDSVQVR